MKERIVQLLTRKLSGEATPEELTELENWLSSNQEDQYFADILLEYWQSKALDHPPTLADSDHQFAHILEMAEDDEASYTASAYPEKKKTYTLRKILAAACLAGIIVCSVWFFQKDQHPQTAGTSTVKSELIAEKGFRSQITLPDGSKVWLNSDSKLQYDQNFNDSIREVTLDGEAFFDVVKNPDRPFIVHTSSIDIKVLGTAFNVKSYARDKTIETTLIHGLVEVTQKNKGEQSRIILRPKEKLVYNRVETEFEKNNINVPVEPKNKTLAIAILPLPKNVADTAIKETSWIYNRLDFEGDTFRELAVKMERWFNVTITFNSPEIASQRLRGSFENETVEEALRALQLITKFKFKKNGNEIEISN